jgi:hypothetical protein
VDDSRSVLQAPAEMSSSGRFLLPSSTITTQRFRCRSCAGREFTVETRAGVTIRLASLLAYQGCGFGDFAGTHNVYTCVRCAAAVEKAHQDVREKLLASLLFAARNLAHNQFCRLVGHDRFELVCSECREVQRGDGLDTHKGNCRVGRVLGLLDGLMQLEDPSVRLRALGSGPVSVACSQAGVAEGGVA